MVKSLPKRSLQRINGGGGDGLSGFAGHPPLPLFFHKRNRTGTDHTSHLAIPTWAVPKTNHLVGSGIYPPARPGLTPIPASLVRIPKFRL